MSSKCDVLDDDIVLENVSCQRLCQKNGAVRRENVALDLSSCLLYLSFLKMNNSQLIQYCNNPASVSTLSKDTKAYYDKLCLIRKQVKSIPSKGEQFANRLLNMPYSILTGMFTPTGIKYMSVFVGVDLGSKIALNAIYRRLASGVGKETLILAERLALEKGAMFANNAILSTVVAEAVQEGTMAALGVTALQGLSAVAGVLDTALIVVQVLGMVLDSWDPEGYGAESSKEQLNYLQHEMNKAFREKYLKHVGGYTNKMGEYVQLGNWPVKFKYQYAHNALQEDKLKLFEYTQTYLDKLVFNSDGKRIDRSPPTVPLLNDENFHDMTSVLMSKHINVNVMGQMRGHMFVIMGVLLVLAYLLFR